MIRLEGNFSQQPISTQIICKYPTKLIKWLLPTGVNSISSKRDSDLSRYMGYYYPNTAVKTIMCQNVGI